MLMISETAIQPRAPTVIIALNRYGRALMTRDMELIRKIILEIQNRKDVRPVTMSIDGYDEIEVARHLELLWQANLIEGEKSVPNQGPVIIMVKDMTWAGHDFAAVIENDGVWSKMKQAFPAKELATLPLSVLMSAGVELLKHYANAKLGL
jgi:hypothetical protein